MAPSSDYLDQVMATFRPWNDEDRARIAALAGNPVIEPARTPATPRVLTIGRGDASHPRPQQAAETVTQTAHGLPQVAATR